ncbi:MAG TPA: chalcone isomerase family protein [Steroidobacteraceae bacterium]
MQLRYLLAILLGAGMLHPAQGRECKGVAFADSAEIAGTRLVLNGLGVRQATIFRVNVYVAALYVVSPASDARRILDSDAASRLTMQFLRNVDAAELRQRFSEGFEKSSPQSAPALQGRIATFNSWMTDIRSGQRMTFTHVPARGVEVDIAGTLRGTIPGADFARALLRIWLGDTPPNPQLKSGLLGGSCD